MAPSIFFYLHLGNDCNGMLMNRLHISFASKLHSVVLITLSLQDSVNRFGEISSLWQKYQLFGDFIEGL